MKQTSITLEPSEYSHLLKLIKTGKKTGRELNRAYILLALHNSKPYNEI